jgi:hypothetical protein
MMSFKKVGKDLKLPAGAVWLMNSISEYIGKGRSAKWRRIG